MANEARIKSEMLSAIKRLAKEYGVPKDKVGVKIKYGLVDVEHEGETYEVEMPTYLSLVNYQPKEQVTIEKILGIKYVPLLGTKIDPFNLCELVPAYIHAALYYLTKKDSVSKENVSVFIQAVMVDEGKDELRLWLYDGNKPIREVTAEELFDEQNMLDLVEDVKKMQEQ